MSIAPLGTLLDRLPVIGLLRRAAEVRRTAIGHYRAIVKQARTPAFYRDLGVPDTLDGRFELIALHVFLLSRRLRGEGEAGAGVATQLLEVLFADMDQELREMGVGDLGVGKRVRSMGEAYFGRDAAYEAALAGGDLAGPLRRNLFGTLAPEDRAVGLAAAYVERQVAVLAGRPGHDLLTGSGPVFDPAVIV
jgi:cytochrome b pre-mRNA-processing protein 3